MKKIFIFITAIISIIVLSVGIMISVTAQKDTKEFCDRITEMLRITLTNQTIQTDISLPSELTEQQKAQIMSDYKSQLNEIYTENALSYKTYLNAMQTELSSQRTTRSAVTELGVFSTDVVSFEYDEQNVTITVDIVYWTKYINQKETGFDVVFPITKDTLEVEFENIDGKWLISNQNLVNHIFDGDKENERHAVSYTEALEYAKNITPINIFAD